MVTIGTLWIILFISLILIVCGLYFKRKALYLSISGSVIILILGIITFSNSISIMTLDNNYIYVNDSNNDTFLNQVTEDVKYTPINSNLNYLLSFVFVLLGLTIIIGSAIMLYDIRYEEEEKDDIIDNKH